MKKILLLSVIFGGVCMANTDVQFDYNYPFVDCYDVYRYRCNKELTEDKTDEYVNKYCIGDYEKYKDVIKSDTNLLVDFVWFQSYKYMSSIGRFQEGFGLDSLRCIMNDVEKYFKWDSKDIDTRQIRSQIAQLGCKSCRGIDNKIQCMIYKFLRVLCYCEYDADTPEAKKQLVDVLRNDVINTAKAHYENLLKFVHDKCDEDKDIACEFVISLCAENLRDYKSKNFYSYDRNGKKVGFPNLRKIKNDLCDELMDYLEKLCVQYGIDDMKNREVFIVYGRMFDVLKDIRGRKRERFVNCNLNRELQEIIEENTRMRQRIEWLRNARERLKVYYNEKLFSSKGRELNRIRCRLKRVGELYIVEGGEHFQFEQTINREAHEEYEKWMNEMKQLEIDSELLNAQLDKSIEKLISLKKKRLSLVSYLYRRIVCSSMALLVRCEKLLNKYWQWLRINPFILPKLHGLILGLASPFVLLLLML